MVLTTADLGRIVALIEDGRSKSYTEKNIVPDINVLRSLSAKSLR